MSGSKFILVTWPEIQEYMNRPDYMESCHYDSERGVWFIPEEWTFEEIDEEDWPIDGPSIGDLDDALG